MLEDITGIAIAAIALSWAFDILRKEPNRALAWIYAAVTYGVYLFLTVAVCGYQDVGPILAPTPLFVVMAVTQMREAGTGTIGARRRETFDNMTRELRTAFTQADARGRAREAARAELKRAWPWVNGSGARPAPSKVSGDHPLDQEIAALLNGAWQRKI